MKKLISIILTFAMLLSMTTVIADEEIKVYVDGEQVVFDAQPFIENDRVLVPMRAIFEAMGKKVTWAADTQSAWAEDEKILVYFWIGEDKITRQDIVEINGSKHLQNSGNIKTDVPARIVNDRTFVPLRAVSEAFDCDVQWNGETRTVKITSTKPIKTSILNERLVVTTVGVKAESQSTGYVRFTSDTETGKSYENITLHSEECYFKSVGDLEQDAANFGMKPVGEIVKQNGLEYIEVEYINNQNVKYAERYMVKMSDDFLIRLTFSKSAGFNLEEFKKEVTAIMDTLEEGTGEIDMSMGEVTLGDFVIDKNEGFVAYIDKGADFYVYRILEATTSDKEYAHGISIYEGGWPSYDEEYNGNMPIKTVESKFLGKDITWNLYEENNYMQAFIEFEEGYSYHLFGTAESSEQQQLFIDLIANARKVSSVIGNSMIYLYPEEEQEVKVKLDFDVKFRYLYPEYSSGWTVIAKPDGTIISEGEEFPNLYWVGTIPSFTPDFKEGFVVRGSESEKFLKEIFAKMGITPQEYSEFIDYWVSKLKENKYNKIYFAHEEYEECAKLEITPEPDSILRVFMVYEEADADTVLPEQEIKPFERNGFTVVEWGGYLAK